MLKTVYSVTIMLIVVYSFMVAAEPVYPRDFNGYGGVCRRGVRDSQSMFYVLVEAVEAYTGTPLHYSIDAAEAYADIVGSSGYVYVVEFYDGATWSCDWWNPEYDDAGCGGYVNYFDYALFIGHGGKAEISLLLPPSGCCWHGGAQYTYADMRVVSNGVPMVYFRQYIKWVTWAACRTLELNAVEREQVRQYAFSGNKAQGQWDLRYTYLHGVLGMYTSYRDAPYSVSTLEEYADRLKNGQPFVDSWFSAVQNNQRECFLGWCWFQGRPAVFYPRILIVSNGNAITYYDPSGEGMAPYDPNAPYMSPRTAWYNIPYGTPFIVEWVYEVG